MTFESFMREYEYNKYLETTLTSITESNEEKVSTPYKLNIVRNEGLPQEGQYLVNCTHIADGEYYTTNLKGELNKINAI